MKGFTLLELMITMLVTGIIFILAILAIGWGVSLLLIAN